MTVTPAMAAPFLAATVLLGGAGAAKLAKPGYTALALLGAGLPASRRLVRVGALAEVAVAVAALAWPGALTGGLVALVYAGFSGFVMLALRRGWALSSCGCFGRPDARPTYAHAVLNALAAATAVGWAATAPIRLSQLFGSGRPWHGLALAGVSCVVAGLAYLVWNDPVPDALHPAAPQPAAALGPEMTTP